MGRLRAQKEQRQRVLTRVSDEGKGPLPRVPQRRA